MMPFARFVLPLVAAVSLLFSYGQGGAASSPPCKPNLAACPTHGCAAPGSTHALLNQTKRAIPQQTQPTVLTLDDFETLQHVADQRLGEQQKNLTAQKRTKLRNLPVPAGTVSEGALVEVRGFVVGLPNRPSANKSGESVNCRLRGERDNDFHIPVARRWTHSEFRSIVVEMVPQDRPARWTIDRLQEVAQQGRQVRVRGQLFYDNEHVVNDEPDHPIGGQPKRFSLWEVHPITEFMVCKMPKKSCDPGDSSIWQTLEEAEDLDE